MDSYYSLMAGLAVLAALIFFGWRLASRRRSLPCPAWLGWLVELDNPLAKNCRAETVIQNLALRPGLRVLDLGCGPGRVALPMARRVAPGGQVVAVDLQPAMLKRAAEKARREKLDNILFHQAQAGGGPLGLGLFDRAVLVTVLGEIPQRQAALAEIFASLKPGGLLCVAETLFDPHYMRRKTVAALAAAAGFTEKSFSGNPASYCMALQKPESSKPSNG